MTEDDTGKFVQAGKLRLHYHEAGKGEAVICLHGGGPGASGWSTYSRNFEQLATRFRVLLVDLPCYGKSDRASIDGPFWSCLGDSVRELMDALQIEKAHIVGNSMGGGAALALAIDHPARVDRLVLMAPGAGLGVLSVAPSEGIRLLSGFYEGGGPSKEKFTAWLRCMVHDAAALTDQFIDERYAAATRPGAADSFPLRPGNMLHVRPQPLWPRFSGIGHKTLVVWGRKDRANPVDQALFFLNQMPDVRLHVFPQCGHWAHWEKADEFNRLVVDFLGH